MYIEPNTTIRILQDIPLDNSYKHSVYFPTKQAQENYFFSKTKFTLTKQSYQRVERGTMKVEIPAESLYNCNYLMFKNTNFGEQPNNRWFYAFITGVEYINNAVSQITFELDDIQTWFFDLELRESFIERQHTETDVIGDNIQAEPVELGEYINSDFAEVKDLNHFLVLIMITASTEAGDSIGNTFDGVYSGCVIYAYRAVDVSSINAKLEEYLQNPDQVISMYMCPLSLIPDVPFRGGKKLEYSEQGATYGIPLNSVYEESQDFGGYTPKNKKLYTYPYNFVRIDNCNGQSLNLRYEFFNDLTPRVEISGTITPPVKLVMRPVGYKGLPSKIGDTHIVSASENLTLEGYPQCSWNVDTYRAWLAQNSVPIVLNTSAAILQTAISASHSSDPAGAIASGLLGSVTSALTSAYTASIAADQCRGTSNNSSANIARKIQSFYKQRCHVTKDYAEVIDNFFSTYGYAINKLARPKLNARPHWTYIKTVGCNVVGSAPSDAISAIEKIYDRGITFWRNGDEVGNYSLNNQPS